MSQNIYSIQILNDIHNYFPDILYNPGRFRNIQDLLSYIRSVADESPYSRGLAQYNRNIYPSPAPSRHTPIRTTHTVSETATILPNSTWSPFIYYEQPINPTANNNIITSLFGNIFNDAVGLNNLQTFLDQRVPVRPSQMDIIRATIIETIEEEPDMLCAICQDDIEVGQQVRKINHCGHTFHKDCIDVWFRENPQCPTCRHDIRTVSTNSDISGNISTSTPDTTI
jgi:hypothetical protein